MPKCPMFIVEARDSAGALAPDAPQPPFNVASQRQLFEHYGDATGRTAYPGEQESETRVMDWYAANGWHVRPKTW